MSDSQFSPPVCAEYIRLPDMVPLPDHYAQAMGLPLGKVRYLEPGFYDGSGNKLSDLQNPVPGARVVIEFAGVSFVWGVFSEGLRAGQRGDMTFTNVPGTGPLTPFFNEWDPIESKPRLGAALFTLLACERGRGIARTSGQNTYDADLPAAAGFIVSATVNMPADELSQS